MSMTQARDAEYAARLAGGDVEALRAIIDAYWDHLAKIATIITRSPELGKEAVQDAFVQLWDSRETIDPTRGVAGYLTIVTRRRALDLLRHEQRREKREQDVVQVSDAASVVSVPNRGDQALEAAELRRHIQAALQELPPRCREIFLLNRQAGMSYAEIEAMLGVSNATIRNQIARAVRHLALAIAGWREGDAIRPGPKG